MEQEIIEAWAKVWDFAQAEYQQGRTAVAIEEACLEYNSEQPFRLSDTSVLRCVDEFITYQQPWYKVSAWYEFEHEVELHNPMSDVLVPYEEFKSINRPVPPSFLDIFLRKGSLHLVHAGAGVGKTPFTMLMIAAAMSGRKFLNYEVGEARAESVWYLDGELPQWLLQQRINSCFHGNGVDTKGLKVYSMADAYDRGMPLIDLTSTTGQERFLDKVREDKPDIIAMDNRTDFYHGKENENDEAKAFNEFLKRLRSLGPATIINHHSGKSGGYRGASAIIGPMDYVFSLAREKDSEDNEMIDGTIRVSTREKNRFGIPEVGTDQLYTPVYGSTRSYLNIV